MGFSSQVICNGVPNLFAMNAKNITSNYIRAHLPKSIRGLNGIYIRVERR